MASPLYCNGQVVRLWLPEVGSATCTVTGFDEDEGKHALLVHEPGSDLIGPSKAMSDDSTVLVDLRQTEHRVEATPVPLWKSMQVYDASNLPRADDEEGEENGVEGGDVNSNNNNNNNNKDSGDKGSAATIAEQQSEHWQRQARAPVPPTIARHARKAVWEKKLEPGAFWVSDTGSVMVPLPLKDLKELQKGVVPSDIKQTAKCKVACFMMEESARTVIHNAGMEDYVAWGRLDWDEITMAHNVTIDGEAGPRFIRVSQERLRPNFEVQTATGTFKAKYRDSAKDGTSVDGLARLIFRFEGAAGPSHSSRVMVVNKSPGGGVPPLRSTVFIKAMGTAYPDHRPYRAERARMAPHPSSVVRLDPT